MGSIKIWIPIKCQKVREQEEVGTKNPGTALAESTHVDFDLKNPAKEWARVTS
jgi:hypothetical protein